MKVTDEELIKKRTAREILTIIEKVCFSSEFLQFRVNKGSNGQRDLIIKTIKDQYGVG